MTISMSNKITLHYDYNWLKNKFGYCKWLSGKNEDDENVIITIDEESAEVQTLQKNGWCRTNVYYPDGTSEELYEK